MSTTDSTEPKQSGAAPQITEKDGIDDNGITSAGETHGFSLEEEKKLLRRVDWRLVPMCAMIFMIKSVDVNNVSIRNERQK